MATKTKAELEAQVAELQAQLEALKNGGNGVVSNPYAPQSTDVIIVYTSHSEGYMGGTQFAIQASVYGEEFTLTRPQFDELVGKYRPWFKDGRLAVSYKSIAAAAAKGLPIDRDNGLSVDELHNLGTMKPEQIEKLWNKVKYESLRVSIVAYYKEQFEGDVPGYRDRARVDCLNRLTDGAFDYESQVLGGKPFKLQPIDLVTATED